VRLLEHQVRQLAELSGVPRVRDREAPHGDAVDLLLAGRQLVLPRDVVARARRHHLDVGMPRETLGDVARVKFGPAADVRAVALNNNR